VFLAHGFDPERDLEPGRNQEAFARGLKDLIAVAHGHLRNALRYVLLIPGGEVGIRKFCLWALGMAILTLDKIHRNPDFTDGAQVKISRRAVGLTIAATRITVRRDVLLRLLFRAASRNLPTPSPPS
jgi:farnesyl-diphosphate farnesyltransferase